MVHGAGALAAVDLRRRGVVGVEAAALAPRAPPSARPRVRSKPRVSREQPLAAGGRAAVRAHAGEALQRVLGAGSRARSPTAARRRSPSMQQLVFEPLGSANRRLPPVERRLDARVLRGARSRRRAPPREPTRQTMRWTMPAPGTPGAAPGYSKNVRSIPGEPSLVAVEEVVDGRFVLVDGALDHPQAEHARVELDVADRVAGDRADVVDALELHRRSTLLAPGAAMAPPVGRRCVGRHIARSAMIGAVKDGSLIPRFGGARRDPVARRARRLPSAQARAALRRRGARDRDAATARRCCGSPSELAPTSPAAVDGARPRGRSRGVRAPLAPLPISTGVIALARAARRRPRGAAGAARRPAARPPSCCSRTRATSATSAPACASRRPRTPRACSAPAATTPGTPTRCAAPRACTSRCRSRASPQLGELDGARGRCSRSTPTASRSIPASARPERGARLRKRAPRAQRRALLAGRRGASASRCARASRASTSRPPSRRCCSPGACVPPHARRAAPAGAQAAQASTPSSSCQFPRSASRGAREHPLGLRARVRRALDQLGDQLARLARVLDVEALVHAEVLGRGTLARCIRSAPRDPRSSSRDLRLARLEHVEHGEPLEQVLARGPGLRAGAASRRAGAIVPVGPGAAANASHSATWARSSAAWRAGPRAVRGRRLARPPARRPPRARPPRAGTRRA